MVSMLPTPEVFMLPTKRSHRRGLGLAAILVGWLVVFVTSSAIASDAALSVDLNGAWQLERTENFDEYLRKSGTPWWKRKLAELGSSRLRQKIVQEGNRFEIESDSPVETRTDSFVADGATPREAETASGEKMTWIARLEGSALVVDGHGELGHRIVRREVVDGSMIMTIFNPDVDAECRLFFGRAPTD